MSVQAHRAHKTAGAVGCAIITVSDTRTTETDSSGRAIADMLRSAGHTVLDQHIVKDEPSMVVEVIGALVAREDVHVIITTGGTGISRRDSTCEAVAGLLEKELPGFGELLRMLSYPEIGAAAMLTRATAGIVAGRAVFVLPGSEHAVRLALTKLILPELRHILNELAR